MASPAFDSNAWYSIQNFGNDYYIGCSNIGSCGVTTTGLDDSDLFQITAANGNSPYYIRPKSIDTDSNGQPYCVNVNGGIPTIALCSNSSAIWGTGYWNGADAGEGLFFFSTQQGDSQRLYLSNDDDFSLLNYNGISQSDLDLMRWGVSSRSAIDDESYSTVPAAIAGTTSSVSVTTTTSTASTTTVTSSTTSESTSSTETTSSTTSESTSESSSVAPITPSTSTEFITTNPTASSTGSPSTITMVVTPTTTAGASRSSSGSQTSSSIGTPTLVNHGRKVTSNSVAAIAAMLILPSIASWFS